MGGREEGRDGEQEGAKQLHHSKLRLEKGMASHSSFLAQEISRTREVWQATVHGIAKSWDTTELLSTKLDIS